MTHTLKNFIFTLVLGLFSLSASIIATILASSFVYRYYADWTQLGESVGLSTEQLGENYRVIVNYLLNPATSKLNMPYFSMSEQGRIHFEEVKFLVLILSIACFLLVICVFVVFRQLRNQREGWQLRPWLNGALFFPLIVLCLIVVAFDQLFVLFHQVLFRNDLWLFNPLTDPVIEVLPQFFFMILFIMVLLIYEVFMVVIAAIARKI